MADYAKLLSVWNKMGRPRTFEVNHVTYLHEDSLDGPQFKPIGDHAEKQERDYLSEADKIARQDRAANVTKAEVDSAMLTKLKVDEPSHNPEPSAPEDENEEEQDADAVTESPTGHAVKGKGKGKAKES